MYLWKSCRKQVWSSIVLVFIIVSLLVVSPFPLLKTGGEGVEKNVPQIGENTDRTFSETRTEAEYDWWNSSFTYRKKIVLKEPDPPSSLTPLSPNRTLEPIDTFLTFENETCRKNSTRLMYYNGSTSTWMNETYQLYNLTYWDEGETFIASCNLVFLSNYTVGEGDLVYYLYYDDELNEPQKFQNRLWAEAFNDTALPNDIVNPWVINNFTNTNQTGNSILVNITLGGKNITIAQIYLIDVYRIGSNWGGPCCGLIRANYITPEGGIQECLVLPTANEVGQYFTLGQFAVDVQNSAHDDPGSGTVRHHISPDNPIEVNKSWVPGAGIWITDVGPVFARIKIVTSDGGYSSIDSISSRSDGGYGYLNYTFYYTFYYHGGNLLVHVDEDIQSNSMWVGDPDVYIKNFGDWPQIFALQTGDNTLPVQDRKAWYDVLNGLYNVSYDYKAADFPVEPWGAWYDEASSGNASIGVIAINDLFGWEISSLAVQNAGYLMMLQEILRQDPNWGDYNVLVNGTHLVYRYYVYTSGNGTNYSDIRSMSSILNNPLKPQVEDRENIFDITLLCNAFDADGSMLGGVNLTLYNSTYAVWKLTDGVGNCYFYPLSNGTYNVNATYEIGGGVYVVNQTVIDLQYLPFGEGGVVERVHYLPLNVTLRHFTVSLHDWANPANKLHKAIVELIDPDNGNSVVKETDVGGDCSFILFYPKTYTVNVTYLGLNPIIIPSQVSVEKDKGFESIAVVIQQNTNFELMLGEFNGPIPVAAKEHTWFTLKFVDPDHNANISDADLTITGLEESQNATWENLYPVLPGYYNISCYSNITVPIELKITATKAGYGSDTITYTVTVKKIGILMDIENPTVAVDLGENVTFTVSLKEKVTGIGITSARITYQWDRGHGEFLHLGGGVYGLNISTLGLSFGKQYYINAKYFIDFEHESEEFQLTLVINEESEEGGAITTSNFLTVVMIGVGVFVLGGFIYHHFKTPLIIRQINANTKRISRGKIPPLRNLPGRGEKIKEIFEEELIRIKEI